MENERTVATTLLTALAIAVAIWATIGPAPLHRTSRSIPGLLADRH